MKTKSLILLTAVAILTNLAIAQGIGSPGLSTNDDGTATQEIDINRGWNNIAVNVEGVTMEDSSGTCSFDWGGYEAGGDTAYVWKTSDNELGFEPVGLDEELDPTTGYTVGVTESCTLEFEGEEALSASTERSLVGNQWNLITLPPNTAPRDIKEIVGQEDKVDLYKYPQDNGNYFHVHEGMDNGEDIWTYPMDSLENYKSVWVAPTNDITLDFDTSEIGDIGPGGDIDDSDDDSSDDSSGEHDHTLGDLYFWDTEANRGIVNTEAGNNYDGQKVEYDMYDGAISGAITWKNNDRVEHTLWVKNEHNGETSQTTSDSIYVSIPSDEKVWGTNQNGLQNMNSIGCTDYTVAVLPPNWDGSDDDVSSDAEQMNMFTFCPNSRSDDTDSDEDDSSNEEDRSEEELGDLSFEVRPEPSEWTDESNDRVSCEEKETERRGYTIDSWTECEVDAQFRAEAGEGYLDGYRVEADINNDGWDNDPSPFSYDCEGPDSTWCYTSHTNTVQCSKDYRC